MISIYSINACSLLNGGPVTAAADDGDYWGRDGQVRRIGHTTRTHAIGGDAAALPPLSISLDQGHTTTGGVVGQYSAVTTCPSCYDPKEVTISPSM